MMLILHGSVVDNQSAEHEKTSKIAEEENYSQEDDALEM